MIRMVCKILRPGDLTFDEVINYFDSREAGERWVEFWRRNENLTIVIGECKEGVTHDERAADGGWLRAGDPPSVRLSFTTN